MVPRRRQVFAHAQPPHDGLLMAYGSGFSAASWMVSARLPSLPYLSAVARLDRCWTEAHLAAPAPALDPAWLARRARSARRPVPAPPPPPPAGPGAMRTRPALWQRQREGLA
ncbi:MAG: hypothetical protein R3E55_08015 [Burkholderiaceae bacterium]